MSENKYQTKAIPAFSIMEAIVSMAVTAIVMGIIFIIFSIVSERLLDYRNQNMLVSDLNRLTYTVNKDIFESEKMKVSADDIEFQGYSGATVRYQFLKDYILRNNQIFTDTFHINQTKAAVDSVKSQSEKLVYLKLTLNLNVNERNMDLKFYKQVYPNELLQNQLK